MNELTESDKALGFTPESIKIGELEEENERLLDIAAIDRKWAQKAQGELADFRRKVFDTVLKYVYANVLDDEDGANLLRDLDMVK